MMFIHSSIQAISIGPLQVHYFLFFSLNSSKPVPNMLTQFNVLSESSRLQFRHFIDV